MQLCSLSYLTAEQKMDQDSYTFRPVTKDNGEMTEVENIWEFGLQLALSHTWGLINHSLLQHSSSRKVGFKCSLVDISLAL